jgi:hypothetical protein
MVCLASPSAALFVVMHSVLAADCVQPRLLWIGLVEFNEVPLQLGLRATTAPIVMPVSDLTGNQIACAFAGTAPREQPRRSGCSHFWWLGVPVSNAHFLRMGALYRQGASLPVAIPAQNIASGVFHRTGTLAEETPLPIDSARPATGGAVNRSNAGHKAEPAAFFAFDVACMALTFTEGRIRGLYVHTNPR